MANQVIRWEADDGTIFASEERADAHNEKCVVRDYIDNYNIFCNGGRADGLDVIDWLKEHPRITITLEPG